MSRVYLEKNKFYVTDNDSQTIYQVASYDVENGSSQIKLNLVPYCIKDFVCPHLSGKKGFLPAYKSSEKLQVEILNVNLMTEGIKNCLKENGYEILKKEPIVKMYINDPSEEEIKNDLQKIGFELNLCNKTNTLELKSINDSVTDSQVARVYLHILLDSAQKEIESVENKITYIAELPTIAQMIIKEKAEHTFIETFGCIGNDERKMEFIEDTMCEKIKDIDSLITMNDIKEIINNSIKEKSKENKLQQTNNIR